ncbi:filamentous hemagglutinin family outer membrane protein [[Leptolyngbya] sp. PCC 7376]|uniref:two-partner secretion domain-containing protein n=1 Tax=[Leptolyngbya] sp. PCC 7376 TaxID=111781 RepID=UPI00029F0AA7|nr:filamentous hemagglutinin N-terminal domain-containing protein [[Leptolyngbya] sp. PCC 7376]AFY37802.1 filamentous hemagglutinin family outer membrane protein [[Leptolyngbya] sp. PCC 7376]
MTPVMEGNVFGATPFSEPLSLAGAHRGRKTTQKIWLFFMICWELVKRILIGSSVLFAVCGANGRAIADIAPDNSLGFESSVVTPNVLIRGSLADEISGGAIRGQNLFHSFTDFSIDPNQRVYFANPSAIDQIFTRVTGSSSSDISGTLGVNGAADLYFINPNGIYFGDTAYLDIAGSLIATTTDSIPFVDGFAFSTDANPIPTNPLLTVSQPLGLTAWTTPQAEITNRSQLAVGNDLTFVGQSLDLEGVLWSGGDLTLMAADNLQIRDRLDAPFITLSGGSQTLEAEIIDIFALSHPESGLYSYGDLVLRSPNPIIIDSYFNSLGNFSLENTNGGAGDALSPNDPVIRSSGNVTFNAYSGASLHIFAGGSIQTGDITINAADSTNGLQEVVTLSDGSTTVNIDGQNIATLDIRAGTNAFDSDSVVGLITPLPPFFNDPCVSGSANCFSSFPPVPPLSVLQGFSTTAPPSNADIIIGSLTFTNGLVDNFAFISNQYEPNTNDLLRGDILLGMRLSGEPGEISLNTSGDISLVVDSRDDIIVFGEIKPLTKGLEIGEILLKANGDLFVDNGLGSVDIDASSGKIVNDTRIGNASIDAKGTIFLNNSIDSAGNVAINANALIAQGGNQIRTSTRDNNDAGTIFVKANQVELSGINSGGVFSGLSSISADGSDGDAGKISVETDVLALDDGGQIRTSTFGAGAAGSIVVKANEAVTIDGGNGIFSGIISEVGASSTGSAKLIDIQTKQLTFTNGGIISAATAGAGNAGQIKVVVDETATFDGNPGFPLFPSGVFTESLASATGAGGSINFQAANLEITNGATIKSSTQSSNLAGDIDISVANDVVLAGADTGIFADTSSFNVAGEGGKVTVTGRNLNMSDGGRISSSTTGESKAGDVAVNFSNDVAIAGADTGIFADTSSFNVAGEGGKVTVTGRNLNMSDGGRISSSTTGESKAGDVAVSFTNDVAIAGADTGIFADTSSSNAANGSGGPIAVTSQNLTLTDGGRISSSTSGAANAGDIKVDVSNDITVSGEGSGVFASTTETSTGDGGNVDIDPIFIRLSDAGRFSVSAQGSGVAGNMRVVGDFLILDNGFIDASSQNGSGGNLTFEIGEYILLQNGSDITTNAGLSSGGGDGGNMMINVPFVIANPNQDNNITANAFDGDGGNIEITTDALLGIAFNDEDISVRNDITVSSELGVDGEFILNSPDVDPSSGLAKLITDLGDRENRVVSACAAGDELNSFVVTGQGGLAADPSSFVRGSSLLSDVRDFSGETVSTEVNEAVAVQPSEPMPTIRQATHLVRSEQGIELAATHPKALQNKVSSNCL